MRAKRAGHRIQSNLIWWEKINWLPGRKTLLGGKTEKVFSADAREQCASTREIFWYVSLENGDLIDANGSKNLLDSWIPVNVTDQFSWQTGSLHETIIMINFQGFLTRNISLHCGPNTKTTIKVGTHYYFERDRQYDMEVTMLERDAWAVIFAVPCLVLVALFVAARRVGICSGNMKCCEPCVRDYKRIFNS